MERDHKSELRGAKLCNWLAIILVPAAAVPDYFIYPEFFVEFAILRLVLLCVSAINLVHARFASVSYPLFYVCSAALSIAFVFSLMCNLSGEGYRSDYYVGIICVLVACVLMPFPSRIYLGILGALYLTYAATMHLVIPLPYEWRYFVENHIFLLLTVAILSFAHGAIAKLRQEIKTLSGLLPICMYCKNIRDDQGYWNKLESFLSSQADVDFSHGICPNCYERALREVNLSAQRASPGPDSAG